MFLVGCKVGMDWIGSQSELLAMPREKKKRELSAPLENDSSPISRFLAPNQCKFSCACGKTTIFGLPRKLLHLVCPSHA